MSKENKKPRLSIIWQIFIGMLALTLMFIVLTWVFQLSFLNLIFKNVKENAVDRATELVLENLDHADFKEHIDILAEKQDVSIAIFKFTNDGEIIDIHSQEGSSITTMEGNEALLQSWFKSAYEAEGYEHITTEDSGKELVCVKLSSKQLAGDNEPMWYMLILNTTISPPSGTVMAVRAMHTVLSIIFIVFAVVVAYFLSKSISKPVEKMSKKAKNLSLYDYEVTFDEKGPKEICELGEALNSATAELKNLSVTQKELIANISHDLRTPLTMISGYSEVMRDFPDERSPENMQVIIDETARLNSLVNDLLTVSKLQSGTQVMDLKTISLTNAVSATVKRYEKLLEHKEYKIKLESDCEVFIVADETRLLQVVYNLINNAINYTGDDKTVTVKQTLDGDVVRISVIDTGEGISEENLPLIWDRYYKIDKVHKRAILGTGLGLSIVKNILLLHGSRFGVSSEVGKGSTFWFEFKAEKILKPESPQEKKEDKKE
ncbi:MAG: HAMP domain-containing protein [Clostridia bacterium]|nr:HAMP domain-containing protein [Clostridia bacterium]